MNLDLLLNLWIKILGLLKNNGKCILVILALICSSIFITVRNETMIKDYISFVERRDYMSEQYALETAPLLNNCIKDIQEKDDECYDVLLIGYHNTKKSLQGYSYLFIKAITEKLNGFETEPLSDIWKDLDYIYFEDELNKIYLDKFIRINDLDSAKHDFPKFVHRLEMCKAKSAAIYPIAGINAPIGFILILYKKEKVYPLGYYNSIIAPNIQKISTIMDYPELERELYLKNER